MYVSNTALIVLLIVVCVEADSEAWFFHRVPSGYAPAHSPGERNKINVDVTVLPTKIILRCHVLGTETASLEVHKNRLFITSSSKLARDNDLELNHVNHSRTVKFSSLDTLDFTNISSQHDIKLNQFQVEVKFPFLVQHPCPVEIL